MPSDEEREGSAKILVGNPKAMPTDEKLKEDALSLVSQYLHFWDPGEVECTVILSRPNARKVVYGTSVQERDRLIYSLDSVRGESMIQSLLVHGHRRTK